MGVYRDLFRGTMDGIHCSAWSCLQQTVLTSSFMLQVAKTYILCGYKYQVRELVPNRPGALVGQLPELVVTSSEEYWNW
jgi:hypothetical protein